MELFIVLTIAMLVIAGMAITYVVRAKSQRRSRPVDAAESGTAPPGRKGRGKSKPPKPPRRRAPTDHDVASVVEEAEAILRTPTDDVGGSEKPDAGKESHPPEAGTGDKTGVGLLEPELPKDTLAPGTLDFGIAEVAEPPVVERPTFRERLGRTRKALGDKLADIRMRRKIDDEVWDELEEMLILADVGATVSADLVEATRVIARDERATEADQVVTALRNVMVQQLEGSDRALSTNPDGPTVWLVVGVNGTGKTTTIGKLAYLHHTEGQQVVLAAADTFRAAATEQLRHWADRSSGELIAGYEGSDPGSIVFDAVSFARAKGSDLLLVDTAGRLHTKVNLMEELKKIRRVAESAGGAPQEVLLVLDATTGQNGLAQARGFAAAAGVTGVVLTKLDGTAKGGIAFAIEQEFGIPIKLVGLGESAQDLVPFVPHEFVDALFS